MKRIGKFHNRRGFTLAELLIVVAIVAILATLSVVLFNPQNMRRSEYDKHAEAIATAAQSRLTEMRNSGELGSLKTVGERAAGTDDVSASHTGGYRYLFSYTEKDGTVERNAAMSRLLPFGSVDSTTAEGFYAIGFQSDSGVVGEVFWRETPFAEQSADHLQLLSSDSTVRESEQVGYYGEPVEGGEVAFSRLPAPQIAIENDETLALSIYLPATRGFDATGKRVAIRVSLADAAGKAYEGDTAGGAGAREALSLDRTAIYRTYSYGTTSVDQAAHGIGTDVTYRLILDTPDPSFGEDFVPDGFLAQSGQPSIDPPRGKFAAWAKRSEAFGTYFALGDNMRITVTVFCLNDELTDIDDTFMPRSASVVCNGWFGRYDGGDTVTVSCGRHLQNLGKLAALDRAVEAALPVYGADRSYTGGDVSQFVSAGGRGERYQYRSDVQTNIARAVQTAAIDFGRPEWTAGGVPIAFEPVNLPAGFAYYGNRLPIKHLYADAPYDAGLFGYLYGGTVCGVRLVNPRVVSRLPADLAESYGMGVGALAGTCGNSVAVVDCQTFLEAETAEGGAAYSDLYRVEGGGYAGGLIGLYADGEIRKSSASVYTGAADGTTLYAGGLIGRLTGNGSVKDCYAAGYVSGKYAGGLIGSVSADADPSADRYCIEACYSAGHIEFANDAAAGLVGKISVGSGAPKEAVGIVGNYCAVIYGRDAGSGYVWGAAPVYGTFEGDGSLWLRPDGSNNKNYFIPQNGIVYEDEEGRNTGLRIYSAEELRKVRADGSTAENAIHENFVYDYAALAEYAGIVGTVLKNPTYEDGSAGDGLGTHYYLDTDHGVYNNVMPYAENGASTAFYPYLMIRGCTVDPDDGTESEAGTLVHYGDWLASDLIAPDGGEHAYHSAQGIVPAANAASGVYAVFRKETALVRAAAQMQRRPEATL